MTQTKPLRADALRNRTRLLEAAAEVFAERGLGAGLEDIAARAGVGVGTLYRRFADRDELIEALFEERMEALAHRMQEALEHEDAWEGLLWFIETTARELSEDRGLRELFLSTERGRAGVKQGRERLHPLGEQLVDWAKAQGRLRQDFSATDVPILFLMLSTVADFADELSPELWRRYLAFFVAGMHSADDHLPAALTPEQLQSAMAGRTCR